ARQRRSGARARLRRFAIASGSATPDCGSRAGGTRTERMAPSGRAARAACGRRRRRYRLPLGDRIRSESHGPRLSRHRHGRLDGRWLIVRLGFTPYPTGVVTHSIIDAMLALRERGLRAEDVDRIDLAVHPEVVDATGKADLETELDAKFSIYHCTAVALIDGE